MKAFITGGAGFIGTNLAARLQDQGDEPVVFDNLSRRGSRANLEWLTQRGPVTFVEGDLRDRDAVEHALEAHSKADAIYHLAAQVAVTTSVREPREDFEINALGTFNMLEAARRSAPSTPFIYASTNKVYGGLEDLDVADEGRRYVLPGLPNGVPESRPLDFHSPYGCSKGAADQYVLDYARIYDLPTLALRQSCIYGERQMGVEDQGWVAWFLIAASTGGQLTIYGDGKQVRDVLFCEDLVNLYLLAAQNIEKVRGRAYNVGGGPRNTLSLLELLEGIGKLLGRPVEPRFDDARPGDQPVFIADISALERDLGWVPAVDPSTGVQRLHAWIVENRAIFESLAAAS